MDQNKLELLIKKIVSSNFISIDYDDVNEVRKNSARLEAFDLVERNADLKDKAQAAIERILRENEGYSISYSLVSLDMREDNIISTECMCDLFEMDQLSSCHRYKRGLKIDNDVEPGCIHMVFLFGLNKK